MDRAGDGRRVSREAHRVDPGRVRRHCEDGCDPPSSSAVTTEDSEGTEKAVAPELVWILSGEFFWVLVLLANGSS